MRLDYKGCSPCPENLALWLTWLDLLGVVRPNGYALKWERRQDGTLWPYLVTFGRSQDLS
jgi:hypothetical protein